MTPKDNFAQTMKDLLGGSAAKGDVPEDKKSVGVPLSSFGQTAKTEAEEPVEEILPEITTDETLLAEEAAETPSAEELDATYADDLTAQATEESEADYTSYRLDEPAVTYESGQTLADYTQQAETYPIEESSPIMQEEESSMQDYTSTYTDTTSTTEEDNSLQYAQPLPTAGTVGSVTVIAAGTKIVGDIDTDGALCIEGSVKGNVRVGTKLDLNGKVLGDIEAEDIEIISTAVKGNVVARNTVHMDKDTTIVGDVTAKNAEIDGKIKGNLTVSERAHIKVDSILMGNLVSGTVNIEEGAMLKGDISITNIQSENVTIVEPDFDISIKGPRSSKSSSTSPSSTSSSSQNNNRSKL